MAQLSQEGRFSEFRAGALAGQRELTVALVTLAARAVARLEARSASSTRSAERSASAHSPQAAAASAPRPCTEEVDCAPVRVESGGPVTLQRKCLGEHPDSVSLLAAVLVAEGVDRGARKLEPPFAVAAHQRQPRLNDAQHAEVQRFWRRAEQLRGNLGVRLRRFPMLVGDFHARRHEMSARQVCRVLGHLQERDRAPD